MTVPPPVLKMAEFPKWEMKDPSPTFEFSSVIDVSIMLGAIPFAGEAVKTPEDSEKGNGAQTLAGNKRVLQDLL